MCSIWSSASGRPRSGSTATRTSWRGANWKPSSTACRSADTVPDRPRLQLFLASRQHRRGPEQHPPDARRAGPAGRRAPHPARRCRMQGRPASAPPSCAAFLASAQVSPVLTAHPTEVRRKSTIDREMEIAALLERRERVQLHAGRGRGQRRAAAPRRADAVADQSAAPDQADRAGRSRQRPVVLRLHVPARGAAAALRAGGPAEPGGGRRAQANWRRS